MTKQPLVSIIIPTYNRAHLIGETLDSVLAQTYQNWECIIVDDGSTDNTDEVVGAYVKKDKRFKYYHRPDEHLPGGNGARNYGFIMSQGEYVNWFDSDDLMLPEKIELKVKVLLENNVEFVIDKFKNFKKEYLIETIKFDIKQINLKKYIFHKEFWGTCNILLKKKLIENISFNENLKSGQEYNFFVKFIIANNINSGIRINDTLVLRRIHDNSIQEAQKTDSILRSLNKFYIYWKTYNETKELLNIEEKHFFINQFLGHYFSLITKGRIILKPYEIVKKTTRHKYQSLLLLSILYLYITTKLGYNKLRKLYLKIIK